MADGETEGLGDGEAVVARGSGVPLADGEASGVGLELGRPLGLGVVSPWRVVVSPGLPDGVGMGVSPSAVVEGSVAGEPAVTVGVAEGAGVRADGALEGVPAS